MEEVRQLVQEEGREARNLIAFHVAVADTPARVSRKPPRCLGAVARRLPPRPSRRSASAGRDKRSELRARYWALLFGDLQRSIGEIYNTVEAHENLNECQEVILVLENYTRDFKALGEWFRLKWEYDNTPPPQRPQSLAWEIRKTDFVRPESRRTHSVKSSPSVSGKNSPCFSGHNTPSGKNSPNVTGKASPGSGKISPRIPSGHSSTSPKIKNVEFFSNKISASKITPKPEPKLANETSRLSEITENDVKENVDESHDKPIVANNNKESQLSAAVEIGNAKEYPNVSPQLVIIKSAKQVSAKTEGNNIQVTQNGMDNFINPSEKIISQLNMMECAFLEEQLINNKIKNDNILNRDKEIEKTLETPNLTESFQFEIEKTAEIITQTLMETLNPIKMSETLDKLPVTNNKDSNSSESPSKSEDNFADISSESTKSVEDKETNVTCDVLNATKSKNESNILVDINKKNQTATKCDTFTKTVESTKFNESMPIDTHNDLKTITESKSTARPAYSQAAAKPKAVAPPAKPEVKPFTKTTLSRSKTVAEIKSNVLKTQKPFQKKNQASKCSYPFNLTTGRTSLFDSPATQTRNIQSKKVLNKNTQMASGDAKPPADYKNDTRKRVSRPTTLKVDTNSSLKEKCQPLLEHIKDCDVYSSSDTIVTQIEMLRIDSNESLKTLVPEDLQTIEDVSNSIEVLNINNNNTDNEGWFTVKSRRLSRESKKLSKSHWAQRFNQPSATTSLPTLNMIESPKQETMPIVDSPTAAKSNRAKSEQPQESANIIATEKILNKAVKVMGESEKANNASYKVINKSKKVINIVDEVIIKPDDVAKKPQKCFSKPVRPVKVKPVEAARVCMEQQKLINESENVINESRNVINVVEKATTKPNDTTNKAQELVSNPVPIDNKTEKLINKREKALKMSENVILESHVKDLSMIRQKSDVTGLKTKSSRSKALTTSEKEKDDLFEDFYDLSKNRLHSSLESLPTGLARSQESTGDSFDFDKWKLEFKSTFKYFDEDDQIIPNHDEILESADPTERSEIAEMTSQIEENEKKLGWALDFQSEVDQRKLCEEEDLLNRQIMELQQVSDVDLDTETDDTETDAEILCEEPVDSEASVGRLTASLEDRYETALAGMSWAERVDTLGALEALVARDPGRAQQLHAKLSQGIRRRGSLQDALRRLQAKQARAERQRLRLQTERARRIHQLLARVEEVKVRRIHQLLARVEEVKIAKNQLIEEKRLRMEKRLQKAAENRDQHLKDIVRKAHDEEEKLREIAFIKQLEAENRRHDFLDQCRSHTTRLREMRFERLSKLEQKAAREAAVGQRRVALEAARRRRVEALLEARRDRALRRHHADLARRTERRRANTARAEGVRSRLSALARAAEVEAAALRSRIRDKQAASRTRWARHLQAIRDRTRPRPATTSESQDPGSKEEKELLDQAERLEQERREKEKQKAIKKKARKVKQKMITSAKESPIFNEKELTTHPPQFHPSSKVSKVVNLIATIIKPIIDTGDYAKLPNTNVEIADTDSKKERNNSTAIQRNNSQVNGNVQEKEPGKKKKNKKKKSKVDTNCIQVENNNNTHPDVKMGKINASDAINEVDFENEIDAINEVDVKNEGDVENENDVKNELDVKNEVDVKNVVDVKSEDDVKNDVDVEIEVEVKAEVDDEARTAETGKKRNRKKGDKTNNKPKMSGANSVCSSVSDMSKCSVKDRKQNIVIDVPLLEKTLNELYRLVERFDKNYVDKMTFQRLLGVRILGHILDIADREEFTDQINTKVVATTVNIIYRLVSACTATAAYLVTTEVIVFIVSLLSQQLEKDLSDSREMYLAKQLCDCVSVSLDAVLVSTRLYVEDPAHTEKPLLGALRARAHTLVSYMCLCGCISRSEKAGEAHEGIQTLLTVSAHLCQPSDVDTGPERQSAIQSLRVALGTGVGGSREEFCGLFAEGARLPAEGEVPDQACPKFVRAARTAHLLRVLAELDHHIVQEAFGEAGWPLEFRAAVARLLSQHAPSDREAPRTKTHRASNQRLDHSLSETMVLDLIVLVGFVVVNNPQLQDTILDGWPVVRTLCTLPANWLVARPHCAALLPTLAALLTRESTAAGIRTHLNVKTIEEYIESEEAQSLKLVQVMKQARAKKGNKK